MTSQKENLVDGDSSRTEPQAMWSRSLTPTNQLQLLSLFPNDPQLYVRFSVIHCCYNT